MAPGLVFVEAPLGSDALLLDLAQARALRFLGGTPRLFFAAALLVGVNASGQEPTVSAPSTLNAQPSTIHAGFASTDITPALDSGRVWHIAVPLDVDAMKEGAAMLVGRHDFTTFRSTQCQSDSPVKTLDRLNVAAVGAEIHVAAAARSFLHNQVRSMVGCLALVGLR